MGIKSPDQITSTNQATLKTDEHWMQHALQLARQAAQQGEVPVGAVIVRDDTIIGQVLR
jgi:tRNA(Arg) A34 adenosine deaminase TadA